MPVRAFSVVVLAVALTSGSAGCHAVFIRPRLAVESRIESPSFLIRTDVTGDPLARLLVTAEAMRVELEAALPLSGGRAAEAAAAARREIVAFASDASFRRYLAAHFFAAEKAIGFFCAVGGECAVAWHDPPTPEDRRVLRHELVHQHLASILRSRLPEWLEEGLAEDLSLAVGGPPPAANGGGAGADGEGGDEWVAYVAQRFAADAIFASLELYAGRRSWPDGAGRAASDVPRPIWAAGDGGYSMHLLFVRFLESIGEGRCGGALARTIAAAARGEKARLDLGARFSTVAELEAAFHAYVIREGLRALAQEGPRAAIEPATSPRR